MRFTDGKEILDIIIRDHRNVDGGVEWTRDFFDDAPTPDEDGVHHVPDARYPLEQALDMLRGEGDYAETPSTDCTVEYDIIDIATGKTVESGFEESPDEDTECCRGRSLFTDSEE